MELPATVNKDYGLTTNKNELLDLLRNDVMEFKYNFIYPSNLRQKIVHRVYVMVGTYGFSDIQTEDMALVASLNGKKNQYIKCIITRGVGPRPLLSPVGCKASVVVFSRPYLWLSSSGSALENGVTARISNMRAIPAQCMDHKSKNLNYAHFVLIKMEALRSGADEAIILDIDGFVSEGPGYNVFVVNKGIIFTPSSSEGILAGITRETVFEIAKQEGIEVIEARISPYDIYNADEIFFSNTAGAITPVVEVDGRKIASGIPGPITKRIYALYFEMLDKGVYGTPF